MSSPTGGLGQPGPGQPDFNGPHQGAPGSSGWAAAGAQPAGTPQPQSQQYPPAQQYPQGEQYPQGLQSPQGDQYPQGLQSPPAQPYQPTQQYPQGQLYPPTQQFSPSQPYPQTQPYPQQQGHPQPGYGPPNTQQSYSPASSQPSPNGGYQPPVQPTGRPSGSGGRGLILAGVVIAVLIIGLLGWQLLGPGAASQQPTPSASPVPSVPASAPGTPQPTVTRVTESPQPTTSTAVNGGGIGQSVGFKTRTGSGTVTVTKASWADNGMIDPTDGQQYLIVDVAMRGVSGQVTTGPFFASVVDAAGDTHMLTIGAALDNQLAMRTLGPGEQNTGQIAFELEPGAVRFQVLDELLQPVATVEIPL